MATDANLVEIDLLGYGQPTVLAHHTYLPDLPKWRYLINISRGGQRQRLGFYAVPLRERLPRCRIPLRPPDPDVVLDLNAVLVRTYDTGSYDLTLDYQRPPDTILTAAEGAWVKAHLDSWRVSGEKLEQRVRV